MALHKKAFSVHLQLCKAAGLPACWQQHTVTFVLLAGSHRNFTAARAQGMNASGGGGSSSPPRISMNCTSSRYATPKMTEMAPVTIAVPCPLASSGALGAAGASDCWGAAAGVCSAAGGVACCCSGSALHSVRLLLVGLLLIGASTAAGLLVQTAARQDVRCASCMVDASGFAAGGARETQECVVTRQIADGGRSMRLQSQSCKTYQALLNV